MYEWVIIYSELMITYHRRCSAWDRLELPVASEKALSAKLYWLNVLRPGGNEKFNRTKKTWNKTLTMFLTLKWWNTQLIALVRHFLGGKKGNCLLEIILRNPGTQEMVKSRPQFQRSIWLKGKTDCTLSVCAGIETISETSRIQKGRKCKSNSISFLGQKRVLLHLR